MANFKEIVTKAVLGKGRKTFTTTNTATVSCVPKTILGCWVINHNFKGSKVGDDITIEGTYDVNIWYSCDNDTKTEVIKETNAYKETVVIKTNENSDLSNEEIIVRSLKQPTCTKAEIKDGRIEYTIEKQLGVEIVGDTKVKIEYKDDDDAWQELGDTEETVDKDVEQEIDEQVKEDYI